MKRTIRKKPIEIRETNLTPLNEEWCQAIIELEEIYGVMKVRKITEDRSISRKSVIDYVNNYDRFKKIIKYLNE